MDFLTRPFDKMHNTKMTSWRPLTLLREVGEKQKSGRLFSPLSLESMSMYVKDCECEVYFYNTNPKITTIKTCFL